LILSGSELDTFQRCRQLHYYRFGLRLEPREQSKALVVGKAGHVLLMTYYRARQSGASHEEAMHQTEGMAGWELSVVNNIRPDLAELAMFVVRAYWAFHPRNEWQVIAVEHEVEATFAGQRMKGTIDLIAAENGRTVVVDHRFLGRFYDEELAVIDPQLPRYVIMLNAAVTVHGAYRNMISTASPNSRVQRVSRLPVPITEARLDTVQMDTERTVGELVAWKNLPLEYRALHSPRTFNPAVCRFCEFRVPCALSAQGLDEEPVLDQQFTHSEYGYEEHPDPFV
jgi:PD-(D/E)XK nuclease superfamily protein